jgi:colicin import membrane protein
MELALHRARADDLRAQLESARAEAAQLRERAVTAELRVPPQPEPGQKPGEVL